MTYYRSKGEYHDYFTGNTAIPGELITKRERNTKYRYLCDNCFELVNVSRKDVYMQFGVRKAFVGATVIVI